MKYIVPSLVAAALVGSVSAHAEDVQEPSVVPDFYEDSTLSASWLNLDDFEQSAVDYFTGAMTRSSVDLRLPGDGGLALEVRRSYRSLQVNRLPAKSVVGAGWELHFGYVEVHNPTSLCGMPANPQGDTLLNNPVFHVPGGGQEVFARIGSLAESGTLFQRTASGYALDCDGGVHLPPSGNLPASNAGFSIVAPGGMRYYVEFLAGPNLLNPNGSFKYYVTEVVDRHGNWYHVDYSNVSDVPGDVLVAPVAVSSGDGRSISFEYVDALLRRIRYAGQVVAEYSYLPSDRATYLDNLVEVVLQGEWIWQYAYSSAADDGVGSMSRATNPYGGFTDYEYDQVFLREGDDVSRHVVVAGVIRDAVDSPAARWTYLYQPARYNYTPEEAGSDSLERRDRTIVSAPEGTYVYYHFSALSASTGELWKVGLKDVVDFTPVTGPVQSQQFVWTKWTVSAEANRRAAAWGAFAASDDSYSAPLLESVTTTIRAGGEHVWRTDNSLWDYRLLGEPQPQVTTYTGAQGTARVRNRRFVDLPDVMLFGLLRQEWTTVSQAPDKTPMQRNYDAQGNLEAEFNFGVWTHHRYDARGNRILTVEGNGSGYDPSSGFVTQFQDHELGIARTVRHPDQTTSAIVLDAYGRVVEMTDREGRVTRYVRDRLGRATEIQRPGTGGNTAYISYGSKRVTYSRGAYLHETALDGFGRKIRDTDQDLATGRIIEVRRRFDSQGRLDFSSYPNRLTGVEYDYDDYGRITRIRHPAGSRTYAYDYPGRVSVQDERGNVTSTTYLSVAGPFEGPVMSTETAEGVVTQIVRNEIDLPLRIEQGMPGSMLARTKTYTDGLILESETDPEQSERRYAYDLRGNVARVSYVDAVTGAVRTETRRFDENNRLQDLVAAENMSSVTPGGEQEIHQVRLGFVYTPEGRPLHQVRQHSAVDAETGLARLSTNERELVYDAAGNPSEETFRVDGREWRIGYTYDANDRLSSMTYPGGEVVSLSPDSFGWPTRALPYVPEARFHESGQLAFYVIGGGRTVSLPVDERFLLAGITSEDVVDLHMQYDPAGNVEQITDGLDPGESVTAGYDRMNRLVTARGGWGDGSYTYDALGNLTSRRQGQETLNFLHGADNRLQSVTGDRQWTVQYDAFGNVIRRGHDRYGYDGLGNLVVAWPGDSVTGTIRYQYDARGRVVATYRNGLATYSLYGVQDQLLYEETPADSTWARHVYLGHVLVAKRENILGCDEDHDADGIPSCIERREGTDPFDPLDNEADRDSDGLSNLVEYQRGTSISRADTDADGVGDGIEVHFGFDPLDPADAGQDADGDGIANRVELGIGFDPRDAADGQADSDADGISNADEIALGSDRLNPDTDADGMPDGFERQYGLQVVANDAAGDADGDGIPNLSEYIWRLDPANPADGNGDPDGDGISNREEYLSGTDPFSADARVAVEGLRASAGGTTTRITWRPVPGAGRYLVRYGIAGTDSLAYAYTSAPRFDHVVPTARVVYFYEVMPQGNGIAGEGRHIHVYAGPRTSTEIPLLIGTGDCLLGTVTAIGNGEYMLGCAGHRYHIKGGVAVSDYDVDAVGAGTTVFGENGQVLSLVLPRDDNPAAGLAEFLVNDYDPQAEQWAAPRSLLFAPPANEHALEIDGDGRLLAVWRQGELSYDFLGDFASEWNLVWRPREYALLALTRDELGEAAWSQLDALSTPVGDLRVSRGKALALEQFRDFDAVESFRLFVYQPDDAGWYGYPVPLGLVEPYAAEMDGNVIAWHGAREPLVAGGTSPNGVLGAIYLCGRDCSRRTILRESDDFGRYYARDSAQRKEIVWSSWATPGQLWRAVYNPGTGRWGRPVMFYEDATFTDPNRLEFARSETTSWLVWQTDGYEIRAMESNATGGWKSPVSLGYGELMSADADWAGNLVVLAGNGVLTLLERRASSSLNADDITPPVVTATAQRTLSADGTTVTRVVSLRADEPASIYFRLFGGTVVSGAAPTTQEQRYTGKITVTFPVGGQVTVTHRAINEAGLWSQPASKTFR